MATTEERGRIKVTNWKQANLILNRLNRKSNKYVVGLTPMFPIHSYCAEVPKDQVVLRFMFPIDGTISGLMALIECEEDVKVFPFKAQLRGRGDGKYIEVDLKKGMNSTDVKFDVKSMDRLVIYSLAPNKHSVEMSAVFIPVRTAAEKTQVLFDEVLAVEEGEVDEGVQSTA